MSTKEYLPSHEFKSSIEDLKEDAKTIVRISLDHAFEHLKTVGLITSSQLDEIRGNQVSLELTESSFLDNELSIIEDHANVFESEIEHFNDHIEGDDLSEDLQDMQNLAIELVKYHPKDSRKHLKFLNTFADCCIDNSTSLPTTQLDLV